VAVDGPSGAGKSEIAVRVASELDAGFLQIDDFFAADLSGEDWERRPPAERARDCIDWRRLRNEALEPLRAGIAAEWFPFDFEAGPRPDGSYALRDRPARLEPRPVIIIDGAYSSREELADLIDLTVLVEAPRGVRLARLAGREDPAFLEEWLRRWGAAEAYYFTHVRPTASFDLVVANG